MINNNFNDAITNYDATFVGPSNRNVQMITIWLLKSRVEFWILLGPISILSFTE